MYRWREQQWMRWRSVIPAITEVDKMRFATDYVAAPIIGDFTANGKMDILLPVSVPNVILSNYFIGLQRLVVYEDHLHSILDVFREVEGIDTMEGCGCGSGE